jgi:hypothetical protein
MMGNQRKQIWVHRFQSGLFFRIAAYWLIYRLTEWNFLFIWRLVQEGAQDPLEQYRRFFLDYWPGLLVFAVLVPFLAWDAVKFAHRLVGPLVRFQKAMRAVAAGEPVRPVELREGDYLGEVQDDFNHMLENLHQRGIPVLQKGSAAFEATSSTR